MGGRNRGRVGAPGEPVFGSGAYTGRGRWTGDAGRGSHGGSFGVAWGGDGEKDKEGVRGAGVRGEWRGAGAGWGPAGDTTPPFVKQQVL